MKSKIVFLLLLCCSARGFAQTYLAPPLNLQNAYLKGTRTLNGKPGANYWQNTADYTIKASFTPSNRKLDGLVDIDYTNNSPDTLTQIWFKLYPNFYLKDAMRNYKVSAADLTDGVTIDKMSINNTDQDAGSFKVEGTNMSLNISALLPGQKLHFTISYSYILNKGSHVRTGQIDEGSYFIAYFFPRLAVYDDIDGWNKYPYLGTEEFYNDFCHFKVDITVPGNYMVWATGDLKNAAQVYNDAIVKKIAIAEKSDTVVAVINSRDLASGNVTSKRDYNTWEFEADDVTDFAFALSDHYVWQAASLEVDSVTHRRSRVDAVYNPAHKDYEHVINYARKTVDYMSHAFPKWPFPYAHETVVDGLDQMEYPMMVNDNPLTDSVDAIELTSHEIFHTMFPFYMGINETKYGWMDEGWATLGEWLITKVIDGHADDIDGIAAYEASAGKEEDLPVTTLTTQIYGTAAYTDSYPKPALGYRYVKDMLGDELFTKALHYYITQWHGKHPMPYDFFNCINTGAGTNLNWFWKNWFIDRGYPDQAITKVSKHERNEYQVVITSVGTKMVPVDLTIYYRDGTTKKLHKDVSCWRNGAKAVALNFTATGPVDKIILGGIYDPDIHKADNVYVVK